MARLGVIAALLGAAGLLALLGYGLVSAGAFGGTGSKVNSVGAAIPIKERPATPFRLQLLDGGSFALDAQRGRPVVVNFWASWCDPCRDEAPALEAAYKSFGDRVSFVGVNLWDKPDDARKFLHEFDAGYPNGVDESGIGVEYGVRGIPETYFVTSRGRLVKRWIGPITEAQLGSTLAELLG